MPDPGGRPLGCDADGLLRRHQLALRLQRLFLHLVLNGGQLALLEKDAELFIAPILFEG